MFSENDGFGRFTNESTSAFNGMGTDAFAPAGTDKTGEASGFATGFSADAYQYGGASGFNGSTPSEQYGKPVLDLGRLILALFLGIIGSIAAVSQYRMFVSLPMVLRIGIAASFAAGFPLAGSMLFTMLSPRRRHQMDSHDMILLPIALILIFGVACLGQ